MLILLFLSQICSAKKPETCTLLECQKIVGEYNLNLTESILLQEIKNIDEDCKTPEGCLKEISTLTSELQKNINN